MLFIKCVLEDGQNKHFMLSIKSFLYVVLYFKCCNYGGINIV